MKSLNDRKLQNHQTESDQPHLAESIENHSEETKKMATQISTSNPRRNYFAENKHIVGFENRRKSMNTTIRMLVENGLDAVKAIGILPDMEIAVKRIGKQHFRTMAGIDENRNRVDTVLYKHVENLKERMARESKETREEKRRKKLPFPLQALCRRKRHRGCKRFETF